MDVITNGAQNLKQNQDENAQNKNLNQSKQNSLTRYAVSQFDESKLSSYQRAQPINTSNIYVRKYEPECIRQYKLSNLTKDISDSYKGSPTQNYTNALRSRQKTSERNSRMTFIQLNHLQKDTQEIDNTQMSTKMIHNPDFRFGSAGSSKSRFVKANGVEDEQSSNISKQIRNLLVNKPNHDNKSVIVNEAYVGGLHEIGLREFSRNNNKSIDDKKIFSVGTSKVNTVMSIDQSKCNTLRAQENKILEGDISNHNQNVLPYQQMQPGLRKTDSYKTDNFMVDNKISSQFQTPVLNRNMYSYDPKLKHNNSLNKTQLNFESPYLIKNSSQMTPQKKSKINNQSMINIDNDRRNQPSTEQSPKKKYMKSMESTQTYQESKKEKRQGINQSVIDISQNHNSSQLKKILGKMSIENQAKLDNISKLIGHSGGFSGFKNQRIENLKSKDLIKINNHLMRQMSPNSRNIQPKAD
ncbi:UNKNOWN [Stylonychia lemnae]|uniref:Uncharacterized protein n=1 Tax=Stylonychia lemnae TaxID=5949 RepID=A0A078B2Q8_STYLE|nr:UNKNOWN [Stylonychia lemnae]|eukprot:CDW87783.1 UNKNOWN [Stylonychia lemnae]